MTGVFNTATEKKMRKIVDIEIGKIILNQQKIDVLQSDVAILAQSYTDISCVKPLSVRKIGESYELITGEYQYYAAKLCEFHSVPCYIYEINDRDSAILALVEHIQNNCLSFFDEALAIESLLKDYGLTQEEGAAKLGKAQSTIANKLRLLRLSNKERRIIAQNNLTERHARALLRIGSVDDRLNILSRVIKNNLNVEKTEILIENYIGKCRKNSETHDKRNDFPNASPFISTLYKAVSAMQTAGIKAESKKIICDDYVEYRVKIPMMY
jgi:ParB family chromosome partitioning protein